MSGKDVPSATNVIAVAAFLSPITHPNKVATSPTTAVTRPMKTRDTQKANHPLQYLAGGIHANRTFHPIVRKCSSASVHEISTILLFSSS